MNPFALTYFALLLAAAVGFGIGHIITTRHATRREIREYQRGWEAAVHCSKTALARFPTSLGGRFVVRAIGGTVPPMPRTKRVFGGPVEMQSYPPETKRVAFTGYSNAHTVTAATADAGEGAEE